MKKRKQGSALLWVIILFVVATVMFISVMSIITQDTNEAVSQKEHLRAHYISLSGIDIGYAALMAPLGAGRYIDTFISTKANVSYNQVIMDAGVRVGSVDVTIGNVTLSGKRWIQVTSVGRLEGSATQVTNIMRIDPNNHSNIIREKQ